MLKSIQKLLHQLERPNTSTLNQAILALMVFAETLVSLVWIYALSSLGEEYRFVAMVPYAYIGMSYVSLVIFYKRNQAQRLIFTQLIMLLVIPFLMQWLLGGFSNAYGIAIWAILSPFGALLMQGTRASTPWFILFVALALISWHLDYLFIANPLPFNLALKQTIFLINLLGIGAIIYAAMRYFQSQKQRLFSELQNERTRSERLLKNMLPPKIAERLKNNESQIADYYPESSVLFADIANFTSLATQLTPSQLVELLNLIFSSFDALIEKYQVEKIKTIGDAYMLVSGVPQADAAHAYKLAQCALEMQDCIAKIGQEKSLDLKLRIGMHSGPVVAGVIGHKKYSYDLWGETVNLAARLQEHAPVGGILISAQSYALLNVLFSFSNLQTLDVKGLGEQKVYLLQDWA